MTDKSSFNYMFKGKLPHFHTWVLSRLTKGCANTRHLCYRDLGNAHCGKIFGQAVRASSRFPDELKFYINQFKLFLSPQNHRNEPLRANLRFVILGCINKTDLTWLNAEGSAPGATCMLTKPAIYLSAPITNDLWLIVFSITWFCFNRGRFYKNVLKGTVTAL